eukprot:6136505-Amphidinium_carterae.2
MVVEILEKGRGTFASWPRRLATSWVHMSILHHRKTERRSDQILQWEERIHALDFQTRAAAHDLSARRHDVADASLCADTHNGMPASISWPSTLRKHSEQ